MDGFWNLSPVLQSAVFGAIGGAAGALIAAVLRATPAFARSQNVTPVLTILCVGVSLALGNSVAAPYRHAAHVDEAMAYIEKDSRLYATLFKYHPESRAALRAKLADIPENIPGDDIKRLAAEAAMAILQPYLSRDLLNAPDGAIHANLEADLTTMTELQSHPEACVDVFLGKPVLDPGLLTPADLERESGARAAIIEGAALHPSPPPEHPNLNALALQIVRGFQARGYDIHDLNLLGHLDQTQPVLGCRVATEYTGTLAAMPDAQGAAVVKGFEMAARQAKP